MMLGSAENEHPMLSNRGIMCEFSKKSNLCDYNPPMLQTDRKTDRRRIVGIARPVERNIARKNCSVVTQRVRQHRAVCQR